jgi:hypothetical protein
MCFPMNAFWFNHPLQGTSAGQTNCGQSYPPGFGFQNSDERHWDNMGGEVLQASDVNPSDFSNLLSLVQPPLTQAPTFGSGPARPLNLRIIAMLEQLRSGWAALFSRPAPVHLGAHAH